MNITTLAKLLPKQIRVGPFPFKIGFDDGWVKIEDSKKWGACDHGTATITLTSPSIMPSKEMLVSVVLHELLHAVWAAQALPNKVKEEEVIASLEIGLTSLFRDNPTLLDWIKKGLK